MRKTSILYILAGALAMVSCEDFLDETPDNRTELDSEEKITSLLVSAYPTHMPHFVAELMSDNVMDNGSQYSPYLPSLDDQAYLYETVENEGSNDSPSSVWQSCYMAIASANQAIEAIEAMGSPESLNPQRAEALMCRAYGHFVLVNFFCQAYCFADTAMGIPYITAPETKPVVHYDRGTVAEVYAKINADIEEALPMLDDNHLTVPKYHFNVAAGYAFAARFNLYYLKFDKAIEYATKVLGANPSAKMRDYYSWKAAIAGGATEIGNIFPSATDVNNLMVLPTYSLWGRGYSYSRRYGHGRDKCLYETFWASNFWGSGSRSTTLVYSSSLYGNNQNVRFPKCGEFFEYTDRAAGVGFAHVVMVPFRTEETLLCRAEAYALKGEYDLATADINTWIKSHCAPTQPAVTRAQINSFYSALDYTTPEAPTIKPQLHPVGFEVEAGEQENFVDCVLHCRRLELIHEGMRLQDIKRYGIVVVHNVDGGEPLVLGTDSPRRAAQLPAAVINSGIEPNPTGNATSTPDLESAGNNSLVAAE